MTDHCLKQAGMTAAKISRSGIHIYSERDISKIITCIGDDGMLRFNTAYYMKNPHIDTSLLKFDRGRYKIQGQKHTIGNFWLANSSVPF